MKKLFIGLSLIFLLTTIYAFDVPQQNQQKGMSVQIIKEQLPFTKESIKSIKVVKLENNRYGIQIELTPAAAKQLEELTAENINRKIEIVWQQHILNTSTIRSPLGSKFLISSFNKETAEAFVKKIAS